ncbi:aminotransferase class IV [Paludisphaera mucosa]|uniref:branched-chain-amino-acid transaminase n=1 Tax=Paludisphaera mucosa TaxID=3030827 RepID=A0ABT6F568_9BACT|nr:aminotransferase class IV [Paludisphaera mucosa]MDG3002721.1 aminotransferase class IV [Paludisphaera mucosa]
MIWTRGAILADDALVISARDRAFEHGLGLFETLRTWNGRPTLLPRHLDRLRRSAEALGIPLDLGALPTADDARSLLAADRRDGDAMLRITLTGGLSASEGSTLWMRSSPLPPTAVGGIRLGTIGPARQDPLAGHKSLNYWSYRLLQEQARAEGCDEGLLIDKAGCVLEGSRTNVFFVIRGGLTTPPCDGRIVPGIMRGLVVERARASGLDVGEAPLGLLDRRLDPEEVFLTNAVRGVIPVGRWGEAHFPAPGPTTARVREAVLHWLEAGGSP